MIGEGEKNLINPSNTEINEGSLQNSHSFENKISNQLARFSPELKNKTIQLISQHRNAIKNENLFIKRLARSLQNKTEEEAFLIIDQLVKKEIQEAEEQEDIILHEPTISANSKSEGRTQSTTKEAQSRIDMNHQEWVKNELKQAEIDNQQAQIDNQQAQIDNQQAEIDNQQAEIDNQQAEIDNQQAQIDNQQAQIDNQQAQIKILQEQTQAAQKVLNPKYTNHSPEELQAKTNTISPQIKSKLENVNVKVEDYASFLLSKEKIQNDSEKDPANEAFLKSLERLEKSIGIIEETDGGYPRTFNWKTKTFLENPQLKTYVEKSQDFELLDQVQPFSDKMTEYEREKLIRFFGSKELQDLHQEVRLFWYKPEAELSSEEKAKLNTYQKQLEAIKLQQQKDLKIEMRASSTQAPIALMMQYLDRESLGGKTLSDLLEKPQQNAVTLHQESNSITGKTETIMHIEGKINGQALTFYYNLSNPEASLQCDDLLQADQEGFHLGKVWTSRTTLNIQMPSIKNLNENLMKTCSSEKCEQLLRESSSKEDYQESVKELISSTLSSSFSYDERIASRLSRHTEKNLMLQDFQQTFLPPHLQNQLQDPRVASLNPELKRFMQLLDHSSEQKTSSELQDLRKSFQKLNRYLQEPQKLAQLSDPILKSRLQGLYEVKQSSTSLQDWSKAILSFFSLFTSQEFNWTPLDLHARESSFSGADLSSFLWFLDRAGEKVTDKNYLTFFSPSFQKKYEQAREKNIGNDTNALLEEEMEEAFTEESFAFA